MNEKKLTDSENTQQIFDLIRGQIANLSRENMSKILAAFHEISPYWLITGEGDMIVSNSGIIQHHNHTATATQSANLDKLIELSSSQQRTIEKLVNLINN